MLLTVLIIFSFAGFIYIWLSSYTGELSEAVLEIYHKIDKDNASAVKDMQAVREQWEENQHLLYYIFDHTDIDAIHIRIIRAEECLRQNMPREATVEIRELHHLLYYLPEGQGLNLEGIL